MFSSIPDMRDLIFNIVDLITSTQPRPGLHPIPGTSPLTLEAAICPPLLYYIALLFLPPPPPKEVDTWAIVSLRNIVALLSGLLFIRLPLAYHVPQSIGFTYQLGLVGIYGFCRVIDAFFISPYMFGHVPKRVKYTHMPRRTDAGAGTVTFSRPHGKPSEKVTMTSRTDLDKEWTDGGLTDPFHAKSNPAYSQVATPSESTTASGTTTPKESLDHVRESDTHSQSLSRRLSMATSDPYSFLSSTFQGPSPEPVYETARTEVSYPTTFLDRASWALELELSMRGIGFTWTTADVRHTRKTWLPTVTNRLHSILVHVLPVSVVSWAIIKAIYVSYLIPSMEANGRLDLFDPVPVITTSINGTEGVVLSEHFDLLPLYLQFLLTAALGAFLMSAFSLGHSIFAIMLSPLAPSPLSFFPPLYTTPVWNLTSIRKFWSFGWHRLFARLFLVYGVWPGEWLERKLLNKTPDQAADVGKVIGAFVSSAFVHAFSARGVVGGDWKAAKGEAIFFALNGCAVVIEEVVRRTVKARRRRNKDVKGEGGMWYDGVIGRIWWITALLYTGRNFARGWVKSSLVREMAFM